MPVRVVAVIPTYNEVDNVEAVLRGVRKELPAAGVIVVDDGSADGTADLVRRLAGELGDIALIERAGKLGLGSAYRDGFAAALHDGAEICVQLDADGSHDTAVLPALVANVELGAGLAIGSRYVPGGVTENWPYRRLWLSRWANRYAAGVLGLAVNDATAGFRAYSAELLAATDFASVRTEGYGFQIEMTHRAVRAGARIVEFPITFRDRRAGVSKMSSGIVGEAFGLVLRLWREDLRTRRQRRRASG